MKINIFYRFFPVWAVIWGIMSGCAKTETEDVEPKGIPVNMTCRLQVSSFEGEKTTRAGEGLMNGELSADDERKISDLTVIQFDGTGDGAQVVIIRTFANPDLTKTLEIGFMQPLDQSAKEQTIYFIANTGGVFDNYTGTLGRLKSDPLSLSETEIRQGKMGMTGSLVTAIHAEIEQSITLTRRLAKIVFKIDTSELSNNSEFNAVWLQLQSIPSVSYLFPAAEADAITPEANADFYTNSAPIINKVSDGYVWYIPENKRGTNTNNAGEANKNENAPDYSTCVYLEGDYYPAKENTTDAKKVYYKLYPGKDVINDFNIEGNKVYNVTLKITSKGMDNAANDKRVNVINMPDPLPGANCYMVVPGNTLTFNPYASPGEYITTTGWTSYETRMGTKESPKITRVGLVWQTKPGLIKELYNLTSSGEIRLVTNNESGNALIAAYDDSNNILWSWHIWVTDYVLDNVSDDMSDNSAVKAGNGYVCKWNNNIWMDRGIGAEAPGLGVKAFGMCYQWGRKDPFPPPLGNVSTDDGASPESIAPKALMYNMDGVDVYVSGEAISGTGYIFDKAMNTPNVFFVSNTSKTWCGSSVVTDLWQNNKKTFFDPCPAGWRVVSSNNNFNGTYITAVYVNNSANWDTNGLVCKSVSQLSWPYGGYRHVDAGIAKGPGHQGLYWTTTTSGVSASVYGGRNASVQIGTRVHSDGQSVRCVKYTP